MKSKANRICIFITGKSITIVVKLTSDSLKMFCIAPGVMDALELRSRCYYEDDVTEID
jgi:hypothetical protein